jgi:hypothetical protein
MWDLSASILTRELIKLIDCISDGEQQLSAFSLYAANELPRLVQRRLENSKSEISQQLRDEWAKFVTSCVEDVLNSFTDKRLRKQDSSGENHATSSLLDAQTLDKKQPLVEESARDDKSASTPATNGSPYYSMTEEHTGVEIASVRQTLTPAVSWELGGSSVEKERIQATGEQPNGARLDEIACHETASIRQTPTPAVTWELGRSNVDRDRIHGMTEQQNVVRLDELARHETSDMHQGPTPWFISNSSPWSGETEGIQATKWEGNIASLDGTMP